MNEEGMPIRVKDIDLSDVESKRFSRVDNMFRRHDVMLMVALAI